jgi:hypothetical protein
MSGRGATGERTDGGVSTMRRWAEYLVAILAGNIVYLFIEPHLPIPLRHQMSRIDPGLALDFLLCVAIFGVVRMARGNSGEEPG